MNHSLTLLIVVLFPVVFIGMWTFVCFLLSRIGGWHAVAAAYPDRPQVVMGKVFRAENGRFGLANYNSTLVIGIAKEGIRLSVWPIFRIGHPPIFLPWEAIQSPERKTFLWMENVSFRVGDPSLASITLPFKAFDAMRQFAGEGAVPDLR